MAVRSFVVQLMATRPSHPLARVTGIWAIPTLSLIRKLGFSNSKTPGSAHTYKGRDKGSWICIAPHCEKLASEALRHMDHTVFTHANTHTHTHTHLSLPRKRSPAGATTSSNSSHLITAYYSFIDPKENERLSWPIYVDHLGRFSVLKDQRSISSGINGYPSAACQVQARESSPVKDRRSTTELHH